MSRYSNMRVDWNSASNRGGFTRAPYSTSYNDAPRYNTPIRKRSGARVMEKEGAIIVSAWKKDKGGFKTLYARPYRNTKSVTSKNGKVWDNLFVTIVNQTTGQTTNCGGMYERGSRRLYLKDFNQIVTTKGKGGYWGKHLGSFSNNRY